MANETQNPLFTSQWYLKNTGQRDTSGTGAYAGIDINITPVWADYTGAGIVVAVNDDGMDIAHPDLAGNIISAKVFDSERGTTGQGFVATKTTTSEHGTVVGSIIAMANNGIGGVGVAYEAKLVPGTYSATTVIPEPANYPGGSASAFLANLASGAMISCNSWGSDPAFSDNPSATNGTAQDQATAAALLRCVTEARGGLGMVIEVSGGNERANKADAGMVHFNSARYIISVGAVTDQGVVTDYSTPGASLLVTAPGGVGAPDQSDNSGYGIVSADIQGDKGYNKTAGITGDYAYQNQGTSYSGPMVAGIAALMLQANASLGFRDVADILAMTARKNDLASPSWVATKGGNWNMTDMHFSRDYGFGLVDATAAVHLAESWNVIAGTVSNWVSKDAVSTTATATIPETGALTVTAAMADNIRIDRVEVLLDLGATLPSQLKATLTSPGGTTVTLFDGPLNRPLKDGAPDLSVAETAWPGIFNIGATAFLGETSQGTWIINLFDTVAGTTATYTSATVRAWGSAITTDDNLVFTNEFTGTKTLTDTVGSDTLNAAAVSTAVTLDLRANAKSTVTTGDITLASGTVVENAIGGSGADTLIGNDGDNTLRGNRGNDIIIGGAGTDTAVYRGKDTDYIITSTANGFTVTSINGITEGTDTLTGIEKLKFSNLTKDLTSTKSIIYSATTLAEATANNGSITATITLNLVGDTFAGAVGATLGTVTKTPTGLTAVLVKASDTTATLSFTGNASAHANVNDITNLTVTLGNADFTGGSAATVTGTTKSDLKIDFVDPVTTPAGQTTAKVYLGVNDNFTISNSGTTLFGNTGTDVVTLSAITTGVVMDQNVDRIIFADALASYTFKQTGNKINVHDASGDTLVTSLPVQGDADGTVLSFSDGSASAKLSAGIMALGDISLSGVAPASVNPTLTSSPVTPTASSTAKVYLGLNDNFTISSSGTTLYGNTGIDKVTLAVGVSSTVLDQNVEEVVFLNASGNFAFKQTGNKINVYDATGVTLMTSLPVQGDADGTVLSFSNGSFSAKLAAGVMTLGQATVSGTAATPLLPLAGQTVLVQLMGVALAQDGQVFDAASFNTAFGAASLA